MRLSSLFGLVAAAKATSGFELNATSYYSPDLIDATLDFGNASWAIAEPTPITYLSLPEASITAEVLKSTISKFLSDDECLLRIIP